MRKQKYEGNLNIGMGILQLLLFRIILNKAFNPHE